VKVTHLLGAIRNKFGDLSGLRVLDVGSGIGLTDQRLKAHLPHLVGVDVSDSSVELARTRNPEIEYHHSVDGNLPFERASFDVVFAICVWHHVPPNQWTAFISELSRVIVPTDSISHLRAYPESFTRLVVSRCAFDADAVSALPAALKLRQFGFERLPRITLCLPFKVT
jgi:SAM-dependent methyltransferase